MVQAEQADAQHAGDSSEAEDWRHKLHHYLDQLFQKDQTAGADYHSLQVTLCPAVPTLAHQHCLHLHCGIITVSETRWDGHPVRWNGHACSIQQPAWCLA